MAGSLHFPAMLVLLRHTRRTCPQAVCSFVPRQIDYEDPPPPASAAETGLSRGGGTGGGSSAGASAIGSGVGSGIGSTARQLQSALVAAHPVGGGSTPPCGTSPATPASPNAAGAAAAGGTFGGAPDDGAAAPPPPAKPAGGFTSKKQLPGPLPRFFDTVLFFHGLNGLELACEAGSVPPGTCVLFNGASMLVEDPGAAVAVPDAAVLRRRAGKLVEEAVEAEGAERAKEEEAEGGAGKGKSKSKSDNSGLPTEAELQAAMVRAGMSVQEQMRRRHGCLSGGCFGGADKKKKAAQPPHKSVEFTSVMDEVESAANTEAIELAVMSGAGSGGGGGGGGAATVLPELVDKEAWRRYCTVVSMFKVYGKCVGGGVAVGVSGWGGGWGGWVAHAHAQELLQVGMGGLCARSTQPGVGRRRARRGPAIPQG